MLTIADTLECAARLSFVTGTATATASEPFPVPPFVLPPPHRTVAMGCGSSTAQPVPVQQAAAAKNGAAADDSKDAQKQQQQQTAAVTAPAGAAADQSDKKASAASAAAGGSVAAPAEKKEKQLIQRLSSEGAAAAAGGAPSQSAAAPKGLTVPLCDSNAAHGAAAVWCASCEENLCASCDSNAHPAASSKPQQQHRRTPLNGSAAAGGADKPKSKFVVREAASTPAQRAAAAQSQGANGSSGSASGPDGAALPGARQFKVGAFSESGEDAAAAGGGSRPGSADAPKRPALQHKGSVPDMAASAGARVKQSSTKVPGGALSALDDDELSRMSRLELDQLWKKYDKDANGTLGRSELRRLAEDVIARLLQLVRDDLIRCNPDLPADELDEKVERERLFVLPGRNMKESQKEMTRMLQGTLDVNGDGKVTKIEYFAQWNGQSTVLLRHQLRACSPALPIAVSSSQRQACG